jgi:putative ABC transport system permease protein
MSDLSIVLRSLRTRLFSTATVVTLVALSAGLLLAILSLRNAGERAFERGTGNAHLLVSRDGSPLVSVLNGLFYANAPRAPIEAAKLTELRESFPWAMFVPTAIGDSYRSFPVVATVPEFFRRFEPVAGEPWVFAEGRPFERNFEIVVGSSVARESGLRLGARIVLTHGSHLSREGGADHSHDHAHVHEEYAYEVVGILKPTGSPHDRALFSNLESTWILHAHDRFEREGAHRTVTEADLVDSDRVVTGVLLRLPSRDPLSAPPALVSQYERLRRDGSITVAMPANEVRRLFDIVSSLDVLFVAMAAATLVTAAAAILLAMINSMAERRRQVAILRVLGASRARIFWLVLTESTLIGLIGAGAGVVLCVLFLFAATQWMLAAHGIVIAPALDPRAAIIVAMSTTALAGLAGLVPSILAYRTSVSRGLRPLG